MRFSSYLASSWPSIAIAVVCAGLCSFILLVSGAGVSLTALVALVVLGAALVALAVDFARKRLFYRDLEECTDDVEHPLWITEMVDEPEYLEGELAYGALRAVAKAANDDVAAYRRQVSDYREYVETWVHEAKSPLAAAHLMLDNLAQSVPADGTGETDGVDGEFWGKAAALGDELDRVEGYIEQALFFARSETLDRDYLIRAYSLDDLVGSALKANAHALIAAHVAPVRTGLDLTVFTDEKWMAFILGQLIQNSVKYARAEAPEIRFSGMLLDRGLATERIELTVSDNGEGVRADDLPRVFDRGFTGANGRTGKRSTGIGLYLVKRLCGKMGLSVRADSVPGESFAVVIGFPTNKMHYFE